MSYKFLAGYKYNEKYSFEVAISNLGRGKFTHSDGSTGDLAVSAYNFAAKYNWNSEGAKLSPYLKVGVARLKNQETLSDSNQADKKISNNFYYGVGFEYMIDASSIYLEYEDFGRSGAFNRDDWSHQPAGVRAHNLTAGVRFHY